MLMASHLYLASRSTHRPNSPEQFPAYLAGSISPDVRYLQAGLARTVTHNDELGAQLAGTFGLGYRHHLAVDKAFYGRCETEPMMRRLGAMNITILAELHALRRLPSLPHLPYPAELCPLLRIGAKGESLTAFVDLCNAYVSTRDVEHAIGLLGGETRERAGRYLERWRKWGPTLRAAVFLASPWLEALFTGILAEADQGTIVGV